MESGIGGEPVSRSQAQSRPVMLQGLPAWHVVPFVPKAGPRFDVSRQNPRPEGHRGRATRLEPGEG